jgi:nitrogen regulatory protein PII
VAEGEAMTRWGYSPIENIAFALQNIAKILERIENKMPVPGGEITTSEILVPKVEEVVEVSTTDEDEDDLPELS